MSTPRLEEALEEAAALRQLLHAVVRAGGGRTRLPAASVKPTGDAPAPLSVTWDEKGDVIVMAD